MTSPDRSRRLGSGGACVLVIGLILMAVSAPCARADAPLIEIVRVGTSEPRITIEIRNDAGRVLNVLGEKGWGRRNYVKVGLWQTDLLAPPPRSSDEQPDLDGVLGPVRWTDPPPGLPDAIDPGGSAVFVVDVPRRVGLNRSYVVVLARAGDRYRTQILGLPLLNRSHILAALLFLVFLAVEVRTRSAPEEAAQP